MIQGVPHPEDEHANHAPGYRCPHAKGSPAWVRAVCARLWQDRAQPDPGARISTEALTRYVSWTTGVDVPEPAQQWRPAARDRSAA